MKSILISIQPEWCALILNGFKTFEVRKSKPKIDTPFEGMIYCSKGSKKKLWKSATHYYCDEKSHNAFDICLSGKVICKFVCNKIISGHLEKPLRDFVLKNAYLTFDDIEKYGKGKPLHYWHISYINTYNEPKELNRFQKAAYDYGHIHLPPETLNRPPQSWCYVEELKE